MTLSLEIIEGRDAERRLELNGPLEIGRSPNAGFTLSDPHVSRSHARVVPEGAGAVVTDLRSTNGTFVNGHQLYGQTRLEPGDHLLVGSTVIELRTAAQVTERPSAAVPVPPPLAVPVSTPDYAPREVFEGLTPTPDEGLDPAATPREAADPAAAHRLDPLLDVQAKRKARTAPLAVFVLVVLALLLYLAAG
jgi:pSer/pThr/pTyr-binding forkhead associated (FHA) protein